MVSARLVQNRAPEDESRPDPFKDIPVCYRVFLVRPDAEAGQDTFGGKDSLNYRVATDGTLLTDKNYPGWYSPEEDRERWGK